MNNPYVHDFSQLVFLEDEEDDGVEACPSHGYVENYIEPTYELPSYGYMAEEYSSPMEYDCRPTNGHQLENNNLEDWPTYGYDKSYYSFDDNHIHEYYDRPTNGFEFQNALEVPSNDPPKEELYNGTMAKPTEFSKLHEEITKFEEMTKVWKRVNAIYKTFDETMQKFKDQVHQVSKQTHPTTTKMEQNLHINEGQKMAPINENSMKEDLVMGEQADLSKPITAKMEIMAIVGQTSTLGGLEPTPHAEPEEEENSSHTLLRQHNVARIEISRRAKLGIKHEWPPPMVPKLHGMTNLKGEFDLSTLNFKKRKRFEC